MYDWRLLSLDDNPGTGPRREPRCVPVTGGTRLRLSYLFGRYGRSIALVLLLVSGASFAGAAFAYTAPAETRQVTEQTNEQTFAATLNTSATVTGNSTLYERGRRLSDAPVYLFNASPSMRVRVTADVPADRPVALTQRIVLELSATRNGEVFWTETRPLATETRRVMDGELVTETTVDVREIRSGRLHEVAPAIDGVGSVRVRIRTTTTYESDAYRGTLELAAPVEIDDRLYAVDAPRPERRSHATPVTRTVTGPPETTPATAGSGGDLVSTAGPSWSPDWPSLGGVGVATLVAAAAVWLRSRSLPDAADLGRAYDEVRYAEWITRGRIPDTACDERVFVEELVGLVDVAIDSKRRVIHDETRGLYAVIDGRVAYIYTATADTPDYDGPFEDDGATVLPDGDVASAAEPARVETGLAAATDNEATDDEVTDDHPGPIE